MIAEENDIPLTNNLWQEGGCAQRPNGTITLHFTPIHRVQHATLRHGETPALMDLSIPVVEIRASTPDNQGNRSVGLWVCGRSRVWERVDETITPGHDALDAGRAMLEKYAASLQV